jgi:hypothetical protein
VQTRKAITPASEVKRPRCGRRWRSIAAPANGPSALVVEISVAVDSGEPNSTQLSSIEPMKMPGSSRSSPAIAATVAMLAGSQIGAGNRP